MKIATENSYPFVKPVPTLQLTHVFGLEYFSADFAGICTGHLEKQYILEIKSSSYNWLSKMFEAQGADYSQL